MAKNKSAVTTLSDPDVERIRRNHLNDLENIVPFVLVGLLYVGTNPDQDVALWHFRIFLASRVLHTLTYQVRIHCLVDIDNEFVFLFSWLYRNQVDLLLAVLDILQYFQWLHAFFLLLVHELKDTRILFKRLFP